MNLDEKLLFWLLKAEKLVEEAEKDGVIMTIERVPLYPLAMRNHQAEVQVWLKR